MEGSSNLPEGVGLVRKGVPKELQLSFGKSGYVKKWCVAGDLCKATSSSVHFSKTHEKENMGTNLHSLEMSLQVYTCHDPAN